MKPPMGDPIDAALREDIGDGDLTTDFFVSKNRPAAARIVARERAIVAGTETAAEVFRRVDSTTEITVLRTDGSEVNPDESVIALRGPARAILKAERVALNFLQRLSGIATMTRKFVDAAASEHVKILAQCFSQGDTRSESRAHPKARSGVASRTRQRPAMRLFPRVGDARTAGPRYAHRRGLDRAGENE